MSKNTLPLEERVNSFYKKWRPLSVFFIYMGLVTLCSLAFTQSFMALGPLQIKMFLFAAVLFLMPAVIISSVSMIYGGIKR